MHGLSVRQSLVREAAGSTRLAGIVDECSAIDGARGKHAVGPVAHDQPCDVRIRRLGPTERDRRLRGRGRHVARGGRRGDVAFGLLARDEVGIVGDQDSIDARARLTTAEVQRVLADGQRVTAGEHPVPGTGLVGDHRVEGRSVDALEPAVRVAVLPVES